ncbi:MAG TPA: hypothetical protein VFV87_14170, partial [Pirellulaceae bacterium]|nr:hypothetical protein [Pirellulaceae bacterium]
VQLERAREILHRAAEHRERFQAALASADGGLGLRISDGVLADLRFLDSIALGCRLEALAAAEALAENEPEAALPPLATMLRAARLVGAEWNVTTRVSAANLRADALDVLQAIAAHDYATRDTHEQLLEMLTLETADWPSDAQAWIGDRAAGLAVYELVRDGYYLSLLSPEEMQRLQEQRLVPATAQAVHRNLDGDELFYLQAMRRIIASCEQPYYQRAAVLNEIRGELAALEQTGDYPMVAGELLLGDFATGHRRQAEDLTRCTAVSTALLAATGQPLAPAPLSCLTGQPIDIERTPLGIQVLGWSLDRAPLEIPLRPLPRAARASLQDDEVTTDK